MTSPSPKTMTSPLRVQFAQLQAVPGQPQRNIDRLLEVMTTAWEDHVELVVTPELYITGYKIESREQLAQVAELCDGRTFQTLSDSCKRMSMALLYSFAECVIDADGGTPHYYISSTLIDDHGERLLHYRKAHLWDPYMEHERVLFEDAHAPPTTALYRGYRIGLLICWDVEFPEPARVLGVKGVDIIIAVGANMDPFVLNTVVPARAVENHTYVLYCNSVGPGFCGLSTAAAPNGTIVAQCSGDTDDVRTFVLDDMNKYAQHRQRNPFFQYRQPRLYAAIASE